MQCRLMLIEHSAFTIQHSWLSFRQFLRLGGGLFDDPDVHEAPSERWSHLPSQSSSNERIVSSFGV